MKQALFLLFTVGLTTNITVMAGVSTSKICKETRFLIDKMACELSLSTQQYNDMHEINYDFIYSVRSIMDYIARDYEWALDDYYEALDIRNDGLRWVLSNAQYRRSLSAGYFYRLTYVTGGRWSFRVYVSYPNCSLFYSDVPYHYRTYCGAHYHPHFHHVSYCRDGYINFNHCPAPHRVRDRRVFHSCRRSGFGSVRFCPNVSTRPHNAPARPDNSSRPGSSATRPGMSRPSTSTRPDTSTCPGTVTRPGTSARPRPGSGGDRPSTPVKPSIPSGSGKPGNDVAPDKDGNTNRVESDRNSSRRLEVGSGFPSSNRGLTNGGSADSSSSSRENGKTSSGSREGSSKRNGSGSYNRNNSSERNNSSPGSSHDSFNRNSSSRNDLGRNSGSITGRSSSTISNRSGSSSSSIWSNVSSRQTERHSSSGSTRSDSTQNSSHSSERNSSSSRR